ncbi:unnamed protein product [Discula destructiva]
MTLLKLLLLPTLGAAHFLLKAPASIGPFDEDTEGTSPCGGVTIDTSKDNVTDFHVGGEAVALFLGHPTGNWLFRATLDQTASTNWSQIYPVVTQTGEGDYCQPAVAAPSGFAGQKGIFGMAVNGPDGLLYQCAVVNFVEGSATYSTDVCKNASGVTATFASDPSLTPLISQDQSQTNGTSTAGGASSSGSSNSSSSTSIAAGIVTPLSGVAGSLAAVFLAGLVGAGLMF